MYLNDDFRPITNTVGFIEASITEVANSYTDWMDAALGGSAAHRVRRLPSGPRSDLLEVLPPLMKVRQTRLLVAEVDDSWVAVFANGWRGSDLTSIAPVLAERLGCRVVRVTCVPHIKRGTVLRYGARLVTVFDGDVRASRSLGVANDGGRWVAHASGIPLPEEKTDWFSARRTSERFVEADLRTLVERLVPGAWQLAQRVECEAALIEQIEAIPPNALAMSLDEVQAEIPRSGS